MAERKQRVEPTRKYKPVQRQSSAPEQNVNELLVMLRRQAEAPDEAVLNETKCLLALSLGRNDMPPLPSIGSKKEGQTKQKLREKEQTAESTESGYEACNALSSVTIQSPRGGRLPSLEPLKMENSTMKHGQKAPATTRLL